MRELSLICLLAASAFAQSGNLGAFTNSGDVGGPSKKGATEFNASNGRYRITGSGANIWAKQDQFQFVWREMSGNFTVTATMQFLGQGEDHRKAGIMLRQSLDTDSPYGDIVIHGNGPGRGALGPDALVPLWRAHTKPAKGPAADQGIRPTLFSLRARHAHGHQLEMHRIAPEIRVSKSASVSVGFLRTAPPAGA
jgi:hypothetical protein